MAASAEGSSFTFSPPPPRSPPADGAPTDGAPTDGAPTDGAPGDGAPTDGAPVIAVPVGAPADGVDSVDAAPARAAPMDAARADADPVSAAPVVGSPAVSGPVGAPSPEPAAAPGVVASAGTLGVPGAAALDERSNRPAGLLALGGATLTVIGDFLPWRRLADEEVSGWQSGASAVVVLGLAGVAVAAAVALLSGVRSLVVRLGLVLGGLVAAGIGLSELMRVGDANSPEATVGLGLLLVVGGGALLAVAGALTRHRRFLPVRRRRS